MSGLRGWVRRVRGVGEAFLDVLRAEVATAAEELGRSGRALVRALALLAAAAGVAFWVIGLLLYFAVELLALVLPRWGAVGVVLGVFVLVALVLALVARAKLRGIEAPTTILQRRLADHRSWWQARVAADGDEDEESEK